MATKKDTASTTKKATTTKTATKTRRAPSKEDVPAAAVVTEVDQRTGLIMKNSTYDKLKFIAQILLPAVATLWVAVSTIWNLPLADQIEGTITAVVVFIDTLLGLTLAKASSDYHKGDALIIRWELTLLNRQMILHY